MRSLPSPRISATVVAILAVMAALMIGAMRQESATVDETTYIGAGYSYFKTGSYRLSEGHPIFSQLLAAVPTKCFDIAESPTVIALREARAFIPYTCRWTGGVVARRDVFPTGPNFYEWALPETQLYGQLLVYDPANNAEGILFACRVTQVVLTLITGVFVFFWARQLAGDPAGLLALLMWACNPIALAYGHLVLTDSSMTLMFGGCLWLFCRFLHQPTWQRALVAGAGIGLSFVMKFTSVTLIPTAAVLSGVYYLRGRCDATWKRGFVRGLGLLAAGLWGVVLIAYFPNWSPAPAPSADLAAKLGVPDWYQTLRPILIPKDFFKGITLYVGMARETYRSYLMGQWSDRGWWYYFPVAMALKTPLALWLLTLAGGWRFLKNARRLPFDWWVPWLGVAVFLGFAMQGKINIGVRHVMPVFPLLAVGVAVQLAQLERRWRRGVWLICAWLIMSAGVAYPEYIQYFNELVGGPQQGYKYLIDSNFDWGADAKRLKLYLDQHHIDHIYLNYFGTQQSIEYHKIPNTRVDAQQARQIKQGVLVVSASELMRPDWGWLRESRQPVARIAYTLFVYQFP